MPQLFEYELLAADPGSAARRGRFHTAHGSAELPAFMPVGTQAAIKGVMIEDVRETGAQIILGNTYHLALRPGEALIKDLGGLHRFMRWDGPILTDSGGFQLFSLAQMTKITERAATFRSHIDGRKFELSPERAVQIQEDLGSDIAMVLDHVVALPSDEATVRDACQRSVRWAARCQAAHVRADQAQFAIVQGGLHVELRTWCAEQMVAMNFPGYAIGGLSVGEAAEEMYAILDVVCPLLPASKPRYLMGVGTPQDLLEGIRRGVDMFDCVLPTRNGRNAMAFTSVGPVRIRNKKYERDERPLDPTCPCPACRHTRAYLRHLFMAGEMLGPMLLSLHNLTYYQTLVGGARQAIEAGEYSAYCTRVYGGWQSGGEPAA
jgi:queuine tRNA-ribosyltransferase